MASLRAFTEVDGWAGCGQGSVDFTTMEPLRQPRRIPAARNRRELLVETVKDQVIPRLARSHSSLGRGGAETARPTADQVVEFVKVLLADEDFQAATFVRQQCQTGVNAEIILLELFTPAARVLGQLWEEDICDFVDVTIAVSRLQQLLREMGETAEKGRESAKKKRTALLVAAPGDQHTFGVFILQTFFRNAGWHVDGGSVGSDDHLFSLAEKRDYDLVGLSVSNEISTDAFASVIRQVRKVVGSPDMLVMVGGRFFLEHPECVSGVGADASAQDGRRAVLEVSSLLRSNALG